MAQSRGVAGGVPPPLASTFTGSFQFLLGHITLPGLVAGMSLQEPQGHSAKSHWVPRGRLQRMWETGEAAHPVSRKGTLYGTEGSGL